ncbi:hypothetical protein [Magnetovibrio sp. PR-2]|uniref:hypothetical protein n=1 Tax=Magnetovibrio sp. PR-2 TaxID=3120356 RepID=UPI003FA5CA70
MNWQPIESAPKDETDIIVGYDFGTVWVVHVAFWREVDNNDKSMGWTDDDTGWWSYIENSITQTKLEGHHTPTHWMALPTPPCR